MYAHGGIGEVVNTPDCGSGTRGFDPHISPHCVINRLFINLFFHVIMSLVDNEGFL